MVNNKPASAYAKPHTMSGGKVDLSSTGYGASDRAKTDDLAMSVAGYRTKAYNEPKTTGIKMRGAGCATKGTMSRGPMA